MNSITVSRTIKASVGLVFRTISDINNFSNVIPEIVNVEILSDVTSGIGLRFRETRSINGREAATELEVTEYVENERVRLIADSYGTVWDSLFTFRESGEGVEVTLVMDAEAYKFLPKLLNPLMKGFIKKALVKDIEAVKSFCENEELSVNKPF